MVREQRHRHQLRASGAAGPQGARPARARHATTCRSSSTWPAASATTGTTDRPTSASERVWDELRSLSPMHAGMSYARLGELGGIQWPCFHEDRLEPTYLHGRLWAEDPAERGRLAPFSVVVDDPPVDQLDDDFPLRLTTGRHLDSYNTGVQIGRVPQPEPAGRDDRPVATGRRRGCDVAEGEMVRVSSRRGQLERSGPRRHRPAARAGVHDDALPGRGRHERADDRGHRSRSRGPPSSRPRRSGSTSASRQALRVVDLKIASARPSEEERSAVDALLATVGAASAPAAARPRSTPSTIASGGSAAGRSTTSPPGWTWRRPTSTAWPPSTRCSRRSSGRPARSTCASTWPAGPPAGSLDDDLPPGAHPSPCHRRVRAGARGAGHRGRRPGPAGRRRSGHGRTDVAELVAGAWPAPESPADTSGRGGDRRCLGEDRSRRSGQHRRLPGGRRLRGAAAGDRDRAGRR